MLLRSNQRSRICSLVEELNHMFFTANKIEASCISVDLSYYESGSRPPQVLLDYSLHAYCPDYYPIGITESLWAVSNLPPLHCPRRHTIDHLSAGPTH